MMRGVSPIVSTILMVAIAIAAAVVVYYITMDVITKQGAQLQEQVSTGQDKIVIDAVEASTSSAKIYVRNIGDNNTKVVAAYVLDMGNNVVCGGSLSPTKDLNAGAVVDVDVPGTCSLSTGTTYIAKVTTTNGVATKTFTVSS